MQLSRKFVVRLTDNNLVLVYAHLFSMRLLYQTSRLSPITNAVSSVAKVPLWFEKVNMVLGNV